MNWVLIGFKSSGKTTMGRYLAAILKRPFYDTDELLGGQTALLYREIGEEAFRQREQQVVARLAQQRDAVIATGGGTQGLAQLRPTSRFIYLYVPPEALWRRIAANPMPAILDGPNPHERFLELYRQREPGYRALADLVIDGE